MAYDLIARNDVRQLMMPAAQPEESRPVVVSAESAALKEWQRATRDARLAIVQEVRRRALHAGSINAAVSQFIAACKIGNISPEMQEIVSLANKRPGKQRTLSKGTVYRWNRMQEERGDDALTPECGNAGALPAWAAEFLFHYRRPQKPSVAQAIESMREARHMDGKKTSDMPSYMQVNRFLKKFSFLDQNRGRMTGSELRAIRAHAARDASDFDPMDIVAADGHSWKGKVAHPIHGRPFNPEVEGIVDIATKRLVGWSAWLSESAQVVADALRHAIETAGIPAIFYSDHGAGNKAKRLAGPVIGTLARMHITPMRSIPGNPQSRGVIERMQASVWIRAAKEHESFSGKRMDSLALRRVTKIIERDLKLGRTSDHLMSWSQFIEFLAYHADAYNNRPHSSLQKITDPESGLRRHMTPNERWAQFEAKGWKPETASPEELDELFRPQVIVTTRRGMISVLGNPYFAVELEHYHDQKVIAEYDVHQAEWLRVRDLDGRRICIAKFEGNSRRWIPKSLQEITREHRANRRLALKREQIREIEAEAMGEMDTETSIPAECVDLADRWERSETFNPDTSEGGESSPDVKPAHRCETATEGHRECGEASSNPAQVRPIFPDEIKRYEWHLRNGFKDDDDIEFKVFFEASEDYRMLFLS